MCLQVYTESTDGTRIEAKESALVWHYRDADPDFGHWQVRLQLQALGQIALYHNKDFVLQLTLVNHVRSSAFGPSEAERRESEDALSCWRIT